MAMITVSRCDMGNVDGKEDSGTLFDEVSDEEVSDDEFSKGDEKAPPNEDMPKTIKTTINRQKNIRCTTLLNSDINLFFAPQN